MPLVLGGSSAAAGAYSIDNSCRFNDDDGSVLIRNPFGTPTDRDKWTFSCWYKLAKVGEQGVFFGDIDSSNYTNIQFGSTGKLELYNHLSGSQSANIKTSRLFKDFSAWYHIVIVWDSGNVTEGDRVIFYINGVRETSLSTETYPAQDANSAINAADAHEVGAKLGGYTFDGYMAEVVFIDGQALTPTSFGEFDEDSPTIFKPINVSGLTFGTNGFHLDFEDSAALGNDVSGNNNDFTPSNLLATDKSQDSPTNNFATMNPLNTSSYMALSNGNNTCTGSSASDKGSTASTISPNAGKWYAECKYTNVAHTNYPRAGMFQIDSVYFGRLLNGDTGMAGYSPSSFSYFANRILLINNSETADWGSAVSSGDITAIAIDCDNGAAYFAIENTWQDSGDPTSGASKTGAAVTWTPASFSGIAFSDSEYNGSYTEWNFGNGCFANTAVTSAEADGNGYGLFEYAPPSGYLALCTKNLGSDGG